MSDELMIGIDMGGTDIKAVLTDKKGAILDELSTPTNDIEGVDNSHVWKASVQRLILELENRSGKKISTVGISSPGTANPENTGILSNGTKLLGVEGFVWNEYLGRPAFVLNDAHAALYAESKIGIGKGYKNMLMITLGTGVGGGIMIEGKLLQGMMGRAGHIGHISVNQDSTMGITNTPGSLENSIGQCTLKKRSYGKYLTTKDLVEAYEAGDTFATWVWLNSIQSLARGITSFINILSPEVVILGGGISRAGASLMKPLKDFMEIYEWRPNDFTTPIKFAKLGNHAGALGAAFFAHKKIHAQ